MGILGYLLWIVTIVVCYYLSVFVVKKWDKKYIIQKD